MEHWFFEVKVVEYAPQTANCPHCGAPSKRHSKRVRHPIDIDLDHPVILECIVGVYKCPNGCGFFRIQPPFLSKGAHYTNRAKEKCVVSIRDDQMPISSVPQRVARDFSIYPVKSTIHLWYNQAGKQLDLFQDYEPWVVRTFSGVLCVDEVYDKHLCLLLATDPLNGKTVGFRISQRGTKEEVGKFFAYLKGIGIDPEVVVSDGSPLYPEAIAQYFPQAKHQLCLFHFIRKLTKGLLKAVSEYRKALPGPPKRRRGRPRKGEPQPEVDQSKKLIYQNRYLFVTREENLSEEKKAILDELCSKHPELALIRSAKESIFDIFDQPTKEAALERGESLVSDSQSWESPSLRDVIEQLDREKLEKVFLFLEYENLNPTNNDVERAARLFRKRQKAHYRIRKEENIGNMMKQELMRQKSVKERSKKGRVRLKKAKPQAGSLVKAA